MEAIYTDLRINTSEDADNLNQEYDFISLLNNCRIEKVNSISKTNGIYSCKYCGFLT